MRQARKIELVPRYAEQGYRDEEIQQRREWLEQRLDVDLPSLGKGCLPGEEMRGNIENPIGTCQIPVGIAGPIELCGEHAQGSYYVPMATTEGVLVRSYERGMVALSKAGGVTCRVLRDSNLLCPSFECGDLKSATEFSRTLANHVEAIRRVAEATTHHGRLLDLRAEPVGRWVHTRFEWSTGDAHGMNMVAKGTEAACNWIVENTSAQRYLLFTGASGEKRPTAALFTGGKGKTVVAGCRVPARVLRTVFRVSAAQMEELWQQTVMGHFRAASLGFNGHLANGLTAIFIACGQDVANVANSAIGITQMEAVDEDIYISLQLPSLVIATVGGGTALATSRECLSILDCVGTGRAKAFAEIVAATLLAGELSISAAIAAGEFVNAHETYGRNRPAAV